VSNKKPHDLAHSLTRSPLDRYVWYINPPVGICIPRLMIQ
jgi:hypothetical protein